MTIIRIFRNVIISVLYYQSVRSIEYSFDPPNLKTVLFKESDLLDRCWSKEEVSLLMHRRVFQDLIPRKIPIDLPLLLKYLKSIEETASKIPSGLDKNLVLMAIGDVIGGYLQAIVIPIANAEYYAGNVDYVTVAKFHGMLSRWMRHLSTDGESWSQECDTCQIPIKVDVLNISSQDPNAACEEFFLSNETNNSHSDSLIPESYRSSKIPIPYLDNNNVPTAIALPYKKRNLFSLSDPNASYILVTYYLLSIRCLSNNPCEMSLFNNQLLTWLQSHILPHLNNHNRWYPAFGAVKRVVETIRLESQTVNATNPVVSNPVTEDPFDASLYLVGSLLKQAEKTSIWFNIINSPNGILLLIIFGILWFLFVSLIICSLCWWCCSMCSKKKKKPLLFSKESNESEIKNNLLSIFCGIKGSLRGSKSSTDVTNKSGPYSDKYQKIKLVPSRKKSDGRVYLYVPVESTISTNSHSSENYSPGDDEVDGDDDDDHRN